VRHRFVRAPLCAATRRQARLADLADPESGGTHLSTQSAKRNEDPSTGCALGRGIAPSSAAGRISPVPKAAEPTSPPRAPSGMKARRLGV